MQKMTIGTQAGTGRVHLGKWTRSAWGGQMALLARCQGSRANFSLVGHETATLAALSGPHGCAKCAAAAAKMIAKEAK